MEKFDVVVVGSGPSGATTAYWCAKYGFSTLIIDKAKFPRDKACGGALSLRALKQLNFRIDQVVQETYYAARMYRPIGDYFVLESNSPIAVGVIRRDFDHLLVQEAMSEGAVFKEKEIVERVLPFSSGVSIQCRSGFSASGEVLIGADGVNSTIARQANFRQRWNTNEVGLAWVWEAKIGKSVLKGLLLNCLEFYLGVTPAGYGWIFLKGDYLSVGAGALMKELDSSQSLISDMIQKVKKLHSLRITNPRWHLVPIGGTSIKISDCRMLLVGDAAGFVDPLVGEGIHYAIMSGKLAALSIKKAIERGNPDNSSIVYKKACEQTITKDLVLARHLAEKLYDHADILVGSIFSNKELNQSFVKVLKGEKTYTDFFINILRRIPISIGKEFVAIARKRKQSRILS